MKSWIGRRYIAAEDRSHRLNQDRIIEVLSEPFTYKGRMAVDVVSYNKRIGTNRRIKITVDRLQSCAYVQVVVLGASHTPAVFA